MGVSSSAMIRMASIGGLASMGMCLVWIGASNTSLHHTIRAEGSFPISISQIEMPLPPTIAAATLSLPLDRKSVV